MCKPKIRFVPFCDTCKKELTEIEVPHHRFLGHSVGEIAKKEGCPLKRVVRVLKSKPCPIEGCASKWRTTTGLMAHLYSCHRKSELVDWILARVS